MMDLGGVSQSGSTFNKDVLLSTLACVLALKRWNVGREKMWRGIN
jgi:ent-kaurene synthase